MAKICKIRRGQGAREKYIYAELREGFELQISATLDYVLNKVTERGLEVDNWEEVARSCAEILLDPA